MLQSLQKLCADTTQHIHRSACYCIQQDKLQHCSTVAVVPAAALPRCTGLYSYTWYEAKDMCASATL